MQGQAHVPHVQACAEAEADAKRTAAPERTNVEEEAVQGELPS